MPQRSRTKLNMARRSPDADALVIAGLQPFSTVDWPRRVVATAFLQGCQWNCGYCHNQAIIDPRAPGPVRWSQVTDLLDARVGLLDGVVFSGGEPTMQPGLADAMRQVRERGFGVGLHTSGAFPAALARVLPLADWVGLDIKAPARLYNEVVRTGGPAAERAFSSLRLVLDAGLDTQIRTTVDPTVMTDADVEELTAILRAMGVREHVLQTVRPDGASLEYQKRLESWRTGTDQQVTRSARCSGTFDAPTPARHPR